MPDSDPQRFEALSIPHLDGLYRYAHRLEGDRNRAEDLLQQALLTGLTRLGQLDDDGAFRMWMCQIVRRTWLNGRKRKAEVLGEDLDRNVVPFPAGRAARDPHTEATSHQLGQHLSDALEKLPDDQAEAVWLVDGQGFKYAEVAAILDIAPGTAASRVARGRLALRIHLQHIAREQGVIS